MQLLTRLRNHPSAKAYAANILVVFFFALVIVGVVLGTVLPNRRNSSQANSNDIKSDISSSSSKSCVKCPGSSSSSAHSSGMTNAFTRSSVSSTTSSQGLESPTSSDNGGGTAQNQYTLTKDSNEDSPNDHDAIPGYVATNYGTNNGSKKASTITRTVIVVKHRSTTSVILIPEETTVINVPVSSPIRNSHSGNDSGNEGINANGQSTNPVSTNSLLWGLTYSPYNTDGSCPDVNAVAGQLAKVAAVTKNIRLYSTDCSQFENALQAITSNNLGLSIHAGIWISDGEARMQSDLDQFVSAAKKFGTGLVKGVSVGNEDISKGMSESTLIGYINRVRSRLQSEGLGNIPVYTTEQDALFTSGIATASDKIMVNIHAIFDSQFYSIDASVQSVIQRANNIKTNISGGKPVVIGETGWSSAGNTGPSPLTLANEIAYAQKIKCAAASAGFDYFYFEAKNANWKQGAVASEQNFGIFDANFAPKFDFNLLNVC